MHGHRDRKIRKKLVIIVKIMKKSLDFVVFLSYDQVEIEMILKILI